MTDRSRKLRIGGRSWGDFALRLFMTSVALTAAAINTAHNSGALQFFWGVLLGIAIMAVLVTVAWGWPRRR